MAMQVLNQSALKTLTRMIKNTQEKKIGIGLID